MPDRILGGLRPDQTRPAEPKVFKARPRFGDAFMFPEWVRPKGFAIAVPILGT